MDRRLKWRKTKLLFQKTNILIRVDGTSFHVCVLRTKRISAFSVILKINLV